MTPTRPSRTAEAVCLMRAVDQQRSPEARIIDDPYASWFLSGFARTHLAAALTTGRLSIPPRMIPALTTWIQLRHRYMDDCFRAALADPTLAQVVVLGAGYDMRAARFAAEIAGRPVFEVDFPSTSERKQRVLRRHVGEYPAGDVRHVRIDFQTEAMEDVLLGAGLRPGARTFFFWEGVSMYLRREAVKGTLATLRSLGGPGSGLTMDFWHVLDGPDLLATAHRASANLLHFLSEPITFALHPEDCPDFMRRHGWEVREVADAELLLRRYTRGEGTAFPATYVIHACAEADGR